jgi:glyoxylase-like metal-dependent hydrolase (beta-lactamase superfamily II)
MQAPPLNIPASANTVRVAVVDSTTNITVPTTTLFSPPIPGFEVLKVNSFSFLIENTTASAGETRRVLFDLGTRTDWATGFSPATLRGLNAMMTLKTSTGEPAAGVAAAKDVHTILGDGGVDPDTVEAIVWSHAHIDHTGNPALFGPGTALVVGPNFGPCKHGHGPGGRTHAHDEGTPFPRLLPGYPQDPESLLVESDYKGRTLRQIKEHEFTLTVGDLRALDYFGDGSFYLLDTPGHAAGHVSGLARVSTKDGGHFVLMAGDAFHHMGELRPSPYKPLPAEFVESKLLSQIEGSAADKPLFALAGPTHLDEAEATTTLVKLQAWDAQPTVFVVAAHDTHVFAALAADDRKGFFPNGTINDFVAQGLVKKTQWSFLQDVAHLK